MIIGFDLDDVLLNFQNVMRVYHNQTYGTNFTEKDDVAWNLWERWNCTPEESIKRLQDFFAHQSHYDAPPITGSVDGIKELKKDNRLFVVTAKPENLKEKTLEWLGKHFPDTFEDVIFTKPHFDPKKRKKSEVCRELGVEVFVEDALHNAQDVADAGIPVILLDSPWNQAEVSPPITRVYSWDEIVEKLNS